VTFYTGTQAEVLYSMPVSGAALNTSITKTVISATSTTNPAYQLPVGFFPTGSGGPGRMVRAVCRGTYGCTVSAPTLTLGYYLDVTQASVTSQILLAGTGAIPLPAAAVTNGAWELEFDIVCQGVGSAGTLMTAGTLSLGTAANAATLVATSYMVGAPNAAIAFNNSTPYFLELWATWGTSSATNTIQATQHTIWGMN
jgi:hypothetical protein